MRTLDELKARIKENERDDFFGFRNDALCIFLPFADAKALNMLNDDITEEQWEEHHRPLAPVGAIGEIKEYMTFAWEKVGDHRGLSADRSVQKITEWVWLLGDEATLQAMEDAGYPRYGAPQLAAVCRAYDLPIPDDAGTIRMISGLPCSPDCKDGCRS